MHKQKTQQVLHNIGVVAIVIVIGMLIVWALSSFSDALEAQLLSLIE